MASVAVSSVVLLSGGLDSAANLAFCARQDRPVLALTANYGQRAAAREIQAAGALARFFGVEHRVVDLRWLGALGGSSLTDSRVELPELERGQLDDLRVTRDSAKSVWVPNRNGVLIHVAAAFAEAWGARQVVVGFNAEEAVTFPDNSTEFLERATRSLEYSTSCGVRVRCYTDRLTKTEIVSRLKEGMPQFPRHLIWSCYRGEEKPCGSCESCRRLGRALESWGA